MDHTSRRRNDLQTLEELGAVLGAHDAERSRIAEEYATKWTAEKRQQALKDGDALPGNPPKFPIKDQEDMDNAASLSGNSSVARATVVAHMRKQAKKHSLKLPASLAA
jgi:hypothetical protein